MVCINPSEKSVDNSLSSMNFAIKTSSITKRKIRNHHSRASSITPQKRNAYTKKLEKKVMILEEENALLRNEVDFLRKKLKTTG